MENCHERVISFKRLRFIDYYEYSYCRYSRNVCATVTANLLCSVSHLRDLSGWVIRKYPCSYSYLRNYFVPTSSVRALIIEPSIDEVIVSHVDDRSFASYLGGRRMRRKKDLIIGDSWFSSSLSSRKDIHRGKRGKNTGSWNYSERARYARLEPCNLMQQRRGRLRRIYL